MLTTIDLFAGAGGLSVGFELAGFSVLAANDTDQWAMRTFEKTFPEAATFLDPIESIGGVDLLERSGICKGELDCLIGGPPCQAFSVYNHNRGFHDNRSGLFRHYLRIVEDLMPKVVVMENVTGMLSLDGGKALDVATDALSDIGYKVEYRVLKAERYGVPQERRRIVLVGSRVGPYEFPDPTHGEEVGLFSRPLPLNTIFDAISDLPPLSSGGQFKGPYPCAPMSPLQILLRNGSDEIINHACPGLASINLERLSHIPPGGSWRDIPFDLLPAGMKLAKRSDHTKRYGRPRWDDLSCTMLTKCDPHWGAFFHPDQPRTFSVREAARLQSFPDTVDFQGPLTEQFRQIGNAVPPLLGYRIAESVRNLITSPALAAV